MAGEIVLTGERCRWCGTEVAWLARAMAWQHRPPAGECYGWYRCRGLGGRRDRQAEPARPWWQWWKTRGGPPKGYG